MDLHQETTQIKLPHVDESMLDEEGRVDFDKMRPIVYDSTRRIYRVVGEEVGQAWGAGMTLM